MQNPTQISFHGLDKSDAIEGRIQERVQKLEHFFDRITSCRVVVEAGHKPKSNLNATAGRPFHVAIHLGVPSEELVVKHDPKGGSGEDVRQAVNHAFDTMERRLKDYMDRKIKPHH